MTNIFYLQWHIINECGNRCKHCYIQNYDEPEVNFETAKLILEDFAECCGFLKAEPHLAITGGDPILHTHFWQILALSRKICKWVGVLGNPEKLGKKEIGRLKAMGIDRFQLSLDGLRETHDSIRYQGSFDCTISKLQQLANAGISVSIMSTISSVNYKELIEVMKLSYRLGAKHWSFARYTPKIGDCGISPREYLRFLKGVQKTHKPFEKKGALPQTKESLFCLINGQDVCSDEITGGCGLGTSALTLLPDNMVMACRRHPDSNLEKWTPERGLLEIFFTNEKLAMYREINRIEGCRDCKYLYSCRGCRAAAFTATGDNFGIDPQCPRLIREGGDKK